jgi:hypothetical protein
VRRRRASQQKSTPHDRFGSNSTDRYAARGRGMSRFAPIATELMQPAN